MTKFLILGQSRTGSDWLRDLLSSHPDIHCGREEFKSPTISWDYLFPRGKLATGFKLFYYHRQHPVMRQRIWDDQEIKVIHLRRRNKLRMLISKAIMSETGNSLQAFPKGRKIKVPLQICLARFGESEEEAGISPYIHHPILEVHYKQIPDQLTNILDFLEVPPFDLSSSHRKLHSSGSRELLENYDELYDHFKDTEFKWYFD